MIEILSLADHVVAFRISGTITAEDYDRATAEMDAKLKRHEQVGVYIDIVEFGDITGPDLVRDVRYGLSSFGEFDRFARGVVITDKEWVQAVVDVAQAFLPRSELRTFAPGEHDAAKAWVAVPL